MGLLPVKPAKVLLSYTGSDTDSAELALFSQAGNHI